MLVHLKAIDAGNRLIFERTVSIDPVALIEQSKAREGTARSKGQSFTEGAVPFFASELLAAAGDGAPESELLRQSINTAMAAWLADSIFHGVAREAFIHSNLHFTLMPDGRVKYDRIAAGQ
jgi:hypothetical protein